MARGSAAVRIGMALIGAAGFFAGWAELPPDLPGTEVKHEDLLSAVPQDTAHKTEGQKAGPGVFEQEQKTWDAPPLSEQMGGAASFVPIGKGGIFVPRFTSANTEPEVIVLDSAGHTVTSGHPGGTFSVEPGAYTVVLGSGAHDQRITRKVTVEEGRTVSILPDWSGLSVETVDSLGVPFRGQYELLRIDEFESFGQGYGAKPELGEVVKTWIVKPGVYKLLGVGQSYNSLTGFVTVRLLPGELSRFLLVQDSTDRILGGGTVDVTPQAKLTSAWKYGASIGGNIKFNAEINTGLRDTVTNTDCGLLTTLWLTYRKEPYDWQTHVRLNEGFDFSGLKLNNLVSDADDFLLTSLFIWRFVSWLGPYANTQVRTTFAPEKLLLSNSGNNYFTIVSDNGQLSPTQVFDSSQSKIIKHSFTPFTLNFGAGLNADALNFPFLDAKVRGGFGGSYTYFPSQYSIGDTSSFVNYSDTAVATKVADSIKAKIRRSIILVQVPEASEFDIGPQASVSATLRIGRVITADGEVDVFAPVAPTPRLTDWNVNIISTISWRITHWMSLDYSYTSQYQPAQGSTPGINVSTHWVYLRFAYASR